MAKSVEEARAALNEAETKLAAATTTKEKIAASKEAATARKDLATANRTAAEVVRENARIARENADPEIARDRAIAAAVAEAQKQYGSAATNIEFDYNPTTGTTYVKGFKTDVQGETFTPGTPLESGYGSYGAFEASSAARDERIRTLLTGLIESDQGWVKIGGFTRADDPSFTTEDISGAADWKKELSTISYAYSSGGKMPIARRQDPNNPNNYQFVNTDGSVITVPKDYGEKRQAAAAGGSSTVSSTGGGNVGGDITGNGAQYYTYDPATGTYKPVSSTTRTDSTYLTAEEYNKRTNAMSGLVSLFSRYGLESLIPTIRTLAMEGAGEDTIALRLQETPEYQIRFAGNQDRIKKGLRVLSPSEYLNLEDDYRQILRAYGLKTFDTDAYVKQFISNDISTTELSNRVVTAVQRVQNADPAILTTLRSFYGITDNDLVAYVLDPNQQYQKIERQVAAAEIGAAAGLQGLNIGSPVAEQLAAQGITKAQAQKGYSTIADILPTAEKLSGIYDKTLPSYGLAEAEQEVFNTLASAQRKRRALAEREIAAFGGQSGVGKTTLGRQTGGQY